MSDREIWSKGGSIIVRDLLASLFAALLLEAGAPDAPLTLCSPFLSDFRLFDNGLGHFTALIHADPELGDCDAILFGDALGELAHRRPVRILTVADEGSLTFLRRVVRTDRPGLEARLAPDLLHEKGLLAADRFYLEGSMNFTYYGVYRRDEKVVAHLASSAEGRRRVDAATLEFDRLWANRADHVFRPETA